eukprot:scaffold553120_cov42-Prasinocladus_malaysianus.AAC.1
MYRAPSLSRQCVSQRGSSEFGLLSGGLLQRVRRVVSRETQYKKRVGTSWEYKTACGKKEKAPLVVKSAA